MGNRVEILTEQIDSLVMARIGGSPSAATRARFTSFYEKCPVLKADAEIRESRLVLCDLTARTLETGLGLLGIEAPDQM